MIKEQIRVNGPQDGTSEDLFRRIEEALDRIRERAYSLFQLRGGANDEEIEDWLRAERELFQTPESELSENDAQYNLRVAIPGYASNRLNIAAEPRSITVHGTAERDMKQSDGHHQLESKELFRRFHLDSTINTDRVKASLEDGILTIAMPKADLDFQAISGLQPASEQTSAQAA